MAGIAPSLSESMPSALTLAAGTMMTPEEAAHRSLKRRQLLGIIGMSYVIDAAILLIYAYAGVTSVMTGAAYGLFGLLSLALHIALVETNFNDHIKQQYFVLYRSAVSVGMTMVFLYIAPEVGVLFLCSIFLIFTFSALRANVWQTAIGWSFTTMGLAWIFLFTNKQIGLPFSTPIERFATLLVFVSVLGRGMIVGLFSTSLQAALRKRSAELKDAYKRIEELADLDVLTGASNRRSIMNTLDYEIARSRRSHTPLAVALIDLDWFKRINDRFGHPAGDEVLRTFAITVFANIRSIDKFGRYGGEEFLLVLPETHAGPAERLLDRLRSIVSDLDWTAIGDGMNVTISAGVTALRPNDTADSLLIRADGALYRAKDLGRDRVSLK